MFLDARSVDNPKEAATKEQARSAQEQLAAAIEGFPEAVVLFDADDRLVVANRAWRDFDEAAADVTHPGTPCKDYIRGLMDLVVVPSVFHRVVTLSVSDSMRDRSSGVNRVGVSRWKRS